MRSKIIEILTSSMPIERKADEIMSILKSSTPIKGTCPSCDSDNCGKIYAPFNRCNDCGVEWRDDDLV